MWCAQVSAAAGNKFNVQCSMFNVGGWGIFWKSLRGRWRKLCGGGELWKWGGGIFQEYSSRGGGDSEFRMQNSECRSSNDSMCTVFGVFGFEQLDRGAARKLWAESC